MAIVEKSLVGEISVDKNGIIFFREDTFYFNEATGEAVTPAQYHRSSVEPGYLDEENNLIPYQLPQPPITKGLITDVNLAALLSAVRTPELMAKWKAKLIKEKEDAEAAAEKLRQDAEAAAKLEADRLAKEEEIRAKIKAEQDAEFDKRVAEALKRSQTAQA